MQARLAHPVYAVGCARKAALSLRPVCAGAIFLVPHNFTGKIQVVEQTETENRNPASSIFRQSGAYMGTYCGGFRAARIDYALAVDAWRELARRNGWRWYGCVSI